VVNERYETGRSVLITSNLDQTQLEEQIGARTVSRLVEMCGQEFMLPMFGDDMRLTG
jgi:DNA replication protein DnaC